MKFSKNIMYLLLLLLPVIMIIGSVSASVAEEVPEEAKVEDETLPPQDEYDENAAKPSADVDTYFLFTKPDGLGLELPSGKEIQFLVGFTNKGNEDVYVDSMDASIRHVVDFNVPIQNFTNVAYNRLVKPKQEVTFSYNFFISDAYIARPYGFVVNLYYRDAHGKQYLNPVFNQTLNIIELDEGFDGESFFLFIFLAALAVFAFMGIRQLYQTYWRKGKPRKTYQKVKKDPNEIDYDWIPKETLKAAEKQSPKARRKDE